MMTVSLRASATLAFFMPARLASFMPQLLSLAQPRIVDRRRNGERHDRADSRYRGQQACPRIATRHRPNPLLEGVELAQQHRAHRKQRRRHHLEARMPGHPLLDPALELPWRGLV